MSSLPNAPRRALQPPIPGLLMRPADDRELRVRVITIGMIVIAGGGVLGLLSIVSSLRAGLPLHWFQIGLPVIVIFSLVNNAVLLRQIRSSGESRAASLTPER